jgi:hypothetical protein
MERTIPVALGFVLALGACGTDHYFPGQDFDRAGTWQADGVNERNLRAQVADPDHLTRGVGDATDGANHASRAVRAFNEGRRVPLPPTFSEIGSNQTTPNTGVSGGGGGGGRGGGN